MKLASVILLCGLVACIAYLYFDNPRVNQAGVNVGPIPDQTLDKPAAASWYDNGQETPADDGSEVVLGIRVRKDRNCTVELNDYVTAEGEMFSAYSCTPRDPAPPHPYGHYDDDTLAVMAYADAEAAALLGRRLIGTETRRSYELLIRASALEGGNVEHLAWLADQAFGTVSVNGQLQLANIKRQYELATLATRLGDAPGRSMYLRNELIEAGVAPDELASLDARAAALLQSMQEIQRTVLGEVNIGGQGDA